MPEENSRPSGVADMILYQRQYEQALADIPPKAQEVLEAEMVYKARMAEYEKAQSKAAQIRIRLLEAASTQFDHETVQELINYTPQSLVKSSPELFDAFKEEGENVSSVRQDD